MQLTEDKLRRELLVFARCVEFRSELRTALAAQPPSEELKEFVRNAMRTELEHFMHDMKRSLRGSVISKYPVEEESTMADRRLSAAPLGDVGRTRLLSRVAGQKARAHALSTEMMDADAEKDDDQANANRKSSIQERRERSSRSLAKRATTDWGRKQRQSEARGSLPRAQSGGQALLTPQSVGKHSVAVAEASTSSISTPSSASAHSPSEKKTAFAPGAGTRPSTFAPDDETILSSFVPGDGTRPSAWSSVLPHAIDAPAPPPQPDKSIAEYLNHEEVEDTPVLKDVPSEKSSHGKKCASIAKFDETEVKETRFTAVQATLSSDTNGSAGCRFANMESFEDDQDEDEDGAECSEQSETSSTDGLHPGGFRVRLSKFVACIVLNPLFDSIIGFLIVLNGVSIGAETDYMMTNDTDKSPFFFRIFEVVLCVIFTMEVVLRMCLDIRSFFFGEAYRWNLFDGVLVGMQILSELLNLMTESVGSISYGFMRLLRLFRLIRILRVARLLRFIQELQLLTVSISSSMRSLFYTLILIFLLIYIFGVFLTQIVVDKKAEGALNPDGLELLSTYYGSLPESILSLYQAILGGIDWREMIQPIVDHIGILEAFAFAMFMAFTLLAMMNIVTGVFVESSLKYAKETRETNLVSLAQNLFQETSTLEQDDMLISWTEFEAQLENPIMQDFFKMIDIDISEAQTVFELLDLDSVGSLDIHQFLNGVLALRGPSKAIDLTLFVHSDKQAKRKQYTQLYMLDQKMQSFGATLSEVSRRVEQLHEGQAGNSPKQAKLSATDALSDHPSRGGRATKLTFQSD